MSNFVNTVDVLGDEALTNSLIERTIIEFADADYVKVVGDYAFNGCQLLESVVCILATSVGGSAFGGCTSLRTASFPAATTFGSGVFSGDTSLVSVNAPLATTVGTSFFSKCTSLTEVMFDALPTAPSSFLNGCMSIEEVRFPAMTSITYAFAQDCTALKKADFPLLTSIESYYAFKNCTALESLILRNEAMCALANPKSFEGSTIESGTGYIYVPAALVDSYKADSTWSTYANQFRALEDYTVDGTITGELDESKI